MSALKNKRTKQLDAMINFWYSKGHPMAAIQKI